MAVDAGDAIAPTPSSIPSSNESTAHEDATMSRPDTTIVAQVLDAAHRQDVRRLQSLAADKGGFQTDDTRKKAWTVLLGTETCTYKPSERTTPWKDLPPHRDEDQVRLDVNRSFVHYPSGETEKQLDARRAELQALIVETLRRNPSLRYFQGYHDIVQVFLLVMGREDALPLVRRLSLLRIRDFMLPSFSASVSHLQCLPVILKQADPAIYRILPPNPIYGLAHVLTLYSHDISSYKDIVRLFDFLLANEAIMTIYVFAAVIISKRDQLLELMADEPDDDIMAVVLQRLPEDLDIDMMIGKATHLYEKYPPSSWTVLRSVSKYSVLTTTRDVETIRLQTLGEGQELLDKHAEEMSKQEAREKMYTFAKSLVKKYQRPVVLAMSVTVCLLAVWANRDTASTAGSYMERIWDALKFGRPARFTIGKEL